VARTFDLAVIGSGPGGYRAAVLARLRGLRVAIVERGAWGGTCLNRGCIPKRAWYSTARLVAAQNGFAARGIEAAPRADLAQAWRHQRSVVETVRAGYLDYLQSLGVSAFTGCARFSAGRELYVDGVGELAAANVILATGSTPFVPPNLPLHPGRVLTTDELFDSPPPPGERVAIVGSGVIGTEMSFILAMLGLDVVWVTQSEPLARIGFSRPALDALADALASHGIRPRRSGRPRSCRVDSTGATLALADGTEARADWVLVAAGRRANLAGLELDRAGVPLDAGGFVAVDERMQTSVPGVYAIGDCANPRMTSNHALAEATVAVANIVEPGSARRAASAVPEVVYSALELARIGLSEDAAEGAGREPAVGFGALAASPAALARDEPRGFVRLVADHDSGALLGAEAAGAEAGEWIHVAAAFLDRADGLAALARLPFNHPSLAEELRNATETLAARWGLGAQVFTRAGAAAE
jgi:dihydrolipoamide dehydrogenase